MATHHLEVVPRIIDSSIAAHYQKTDVPPLNTEAKRKPQSTENNVNPSNNGTSSSNQSTESKPASPPQPQPKPPMMMPVPMTFTQRFFATVKDYFIPIIFIIAVTVMIYVLWTYFTKYRKSQVEAQNQIELEAAAKLNPDPNPLPVIDKSELEGYLNNSDNEEEDEEESESEDEEDEAKVIEEKVKEVPKVNMVKENPTPANYPPLLNPMRESCNESFAEPDLDTISILINQSIDPFNHHLHDDDRFRVIEETNEEENEESEEDEEEEDEEEEEEEESDGELITHSDGSTESTDSKENEDAQDDLFSIQQGDQSKPRKSKKTVRIGV